MSSRLNGTLVKNNLKIRKKGVPHIEYGTPFFPLISNPIVIF